MRTPCQGRILVDGPAGPHTNPGTSINPHDTRRSSAPHATRTNSAAQRRPTQPCCMAGTSTACTRTRRLHQGPGRHPRRASLAPRPLPAAGYRQWSLSFAVALLALLLLLASPVLYRFEGA